MKRLVRIKESQEFTVDEAKYDKIYACFTYDGDELCIATKDRYDEPDHYKLIVLKDATKANSYPGDSAMGLPSLTSLLEKYRDSSAFSPIYEFDSVPELLRWALEKYEEKEEQQWAS